MTDQLLSLLSLYVDKQIAVEEIDNWIALNIWDATGDDRNLIDRVAVELAYLKDLVSDESYFRTRMAEILSPSITIPPEVSVAATVDIVTSNETVTIEAPTEF